MAEGTPPKLVVILGVGVFMVLVISVIVRMNTDKPPPQAPAAGVPATPVLDAAYKADAAANLAASKALPASEQTLWEYNSETNALGRRILTACVESSTEAHLSFPYHETKAKLCLRERGGRHDFFLYTEAKSQMICSSYEGCRVPIRYGSEPATSVILYEPSDYDSSYLIANSIPKKLLAAQQVVIAPMFYNEGEQEFVFDMHGLDATKIGYPPSFVHSKGRRIGAHR